MKTIEFIYYKEDDMWIGYLEEYPDYMTQGETIEELKENLKVFLAFADGPGSVDNLGKEPKELMESSTQVQMKLRQEVSRNPFG